MAIIAGVAIPVLLGFTGLAVEYGQVLFVRAEAQRTADLASHAAAAAYARTGSTEEMVAAAQGVARLNGFRDDEIAVILDTSFATAAGSAVRATITTPKPLYLPRLVGGDTSVSVRASAVAGAMGGEPACIQALDPNGTGITLSGSATMRTDECAVASNAGVQAPCGTGIITKTLSYNSGPDPLPEWCLTIRTPDGDPARITSAPTTDPLADSPAVVLAAAQMAATATLVPPSDIVVAPPGPNIHFDYDQAKTKAQVAAIGCDATLSNATWRVTCPGLSTVNVGSITIQGGLSLYFNEGAAPDVTYNFSGRIDTGSSPVTFAGGNYNVAGGIIVRGGSVAQFGAGTYRIGRATEACDNARQSICNLSRLSFAGPSTFILPGGIRNSGNAILTLGTGTGNSFRFGPASNGLAISVGGGSQTYMGDALGGVFEVSGRIGGGGGGSCLVIPAAPLHQINGDLLASGAIRFGAGVYSINGYMHLGSNGGGSADCRGEIISIDAVDTTFLISGAGAGPGGSACPGQVFCVSAGYSNIRITAPDSGPFMDMAVVGPLDPSRTLGATFSGGASGSQVTGAFYFPNGRITLSGGASASDSSAGCFQLIGASITMSGGTSLASECRLPGGSGGGGRVVILG